MAENRSTETTDETELVECVAEAIYERRMIRLHAHVPDPFETWPPGYRGSYYDDARAALSAIEKYADGK